MTHFASSDGAALQLIGNMVKLQSFRISNPQSERRHDRPPSLVGINWPFFQWVKSYQMAKFTQIAEHHIILKSISTI